MQRARARLVGLAGIGLLGLGLAGCGVYSIPRVAANGTTILITVPDGFGAGFGRVLNQNLPVGPTANPGSISITPNPSSPLEDFQRGEILFALRASTEPTSALVTYLPVRYITRVLLDEGSSAALPATGETYVSQGTNPQTGQIVALVDIPRTVAAGTYYLFMERWRRVPSTSVFDQVPTPIDSPPIDWLAWAGFVGSTPRPDAPMELRIVESSITGSLFNDAVWGFDKWFGSYAWRDFTPDLEQLTPRPTFRIWTENPYPQQGTPARPAAWELTIQYPPGKIEILGAELGAYHRSGRIATVSPATSSPTGCNAASSTVTISTLDPDQKAIWVDVVYRLRDFPNCGRAGASDFAEVSGSLRAYDTNGAVIAAPYGYLDFYSSFP